MKYMTFNSSCAFAGIANMLEHVGVDAEDRTIALKMKLPLLFAKRDGVYLAGPMLQSADWFNRYLHTIGYTMEETERKREDVPAVLTGEDCALIGLYLTPRNKHAMVYTGKDNGRFCFINNKWEHTEEPERLELTEQELLDRLDEKAVIATLGRTDVEQPDYGPLLEQSCQVLEELKGDIEAFCGARQEPQTILKAMNTLFRAILLDGITMLELAGQAGLADRLRAVQAELIAVVKTGEAATLSEAISVQTLLEAIDEYAAWIREEAAK